MSVATSDDPLTPKSRRRWWAWPVAIAMTAAILGLGLPTYLIFSRDIAWRDAVAETTRLDPRWQLSEIESDREIIPADENSALRIIEIMNDAPRVRVCEARAYDFIFDGLAPTSELNDVQAKLIGDELTKVDAFLDSARKLRHMPRGRFPIAYADDFLGTLIGEQQNVRCLADWLQHDAYLRAHEGKCSQAVESCITIVNVGRSLGDEPLLTSMLLRLAIHMTAMEALERVLAQGEASEESLRALQASLTAELENRHFLQALRGERGGMHVLFENMRAGKVHFSSLGNPRRETGPAPVEWFVDFGICSHYPDYLRYLNRGVELARLPIHERHRAIQEWSAESRERKNQAIWLFARSFESLHKANCRVHAMLRATVAAIACERYRLLHANWPTSLDEVVKVAVLEVAPLDPMDHERIRLRRTENGLTAYSIGLDLRDNEGTIDRQRPERPGADVGFRLWDVKARRQPPAPPKPLP